MTWDRYASITPILAALALCLLLAQCAIETMPDASTYLSMDTLRDTACVIPSCYPDPRPTAP
jgi:hypothetical protein